MRHVTSWLCSLSVVAGLGATASTSFAQPDTRDHRHNPPPAAPPPAAPPGHDRDHDRDHHPAPPPAAWPTEAPPAPRIEKFEARAGFVWIAGRWDWRANKWEWINGHWEKERAGKRWNAGHWDHQGDRWAWTEGDWIDGGGPPPPGPGPGRDRDDDRPHAPPPAPRDERPENRPGFVFQRGHWEWRDHNWNWVDGHWEKERAGKQWRESRWEQREGAWILVDGEWLDTGIVPPDRGGNPPPPPAPPPPPREWKLDRPVVSSYWPVKGKIGSRIVIRGRNFPADTEVMWNDNHINGAKISPDEIVVQVPPGAVSGALRLRAGGRHELWVGNYEVAADYDAEAEAKRLADEARLKAQQDWEIRQRALAKDRAARQAAFDRWQQDLEQSREQRRQDRLRDIRAKWEAAFLADADTQAELTLHAQRVAEITRMREIADLTENSKLAIRIGVVSSKEDQRHQDRMAALHDAFGRK